MRRLNIEDYAWKKYWRLMIIWEWEPRPRWKNRYRRRLICRCDCWNIWEYDMTAVFSGHTQSCWCYHIDKITTHWLHKDAFYDVWIDMNQRCNNPKNTNYKNYGWRWIKCRWNSFEEFRDDMFDEYQKHKAKFWWGRNTSIERIDNDWDYCKENCKWATWSEQCKNRRCNLTNLKQFRGKDNFVLIKWKIINLNLNFWKDVN